MGFRELVRLLVLWRLAGEWWRAEALYLYFCGGLGPAEIEGLMGVRRTVVAGIVRRAYEAYGLYFGLGGAVSRCFRYVAELEPALSETCRLCGRGGFRWNARHLVMSHGDYVERCVEEVVSRCAGGRRLSDESAL